MKILNVDTSYVGKLVVTKKTNSSDYEDITSTYKYPESKFHFKSVDRIKKRCELWDVTLAYRGFLRKKKIGDATVYHCIEPNFH